ncbi:mediator of RNA polymerase II transcription subunit 11 [Syngnathus typhle]|uniref:mediator of RNA polymerase II transcription subunit 11 n=1 Tax=Syngnathus typhle TaxID=161592 RepID=UPI002A698A6C|nr:mediator of RNA polymerase II transcription subunit 11 [Syngnathus typhle]
MFKATRRTSKRWRPSSACAVHLFCWVWTHLVFHDDASLQIKAHLTMANERLRVLEEVEKEIAMILQCAGNIVMELSKDKHNASLLDRQLVQFQSSVGRVETELSGQIRYLTQVATGQPHEGSTYSSRKDCQMALNRAEYAKVKLGELGRTCEVMLEPPLQQT